MGNVNVGRRCVRVARHGLQLLLYHLFVLRGTRAGSLGLCRECTSGGGAAGTDAGGGILARRRRRMTMTAGTPGGDMSTFRPPSKWADEQRGHRVGGEVHSVIDQIASPWQPRAADEGAGGSGDSTRRDWVGSQPAQSPTRRDL